MLSFAAESGVETASRITQAFFSKDLSLLGSLSPAEVSQVFAGAEEYSLEFVPGQLSLVELALRTKCFDSSLAAVNAIQEGGFYLNYLKVRRPGMIITEQFILQNNITIVSVGKKSHRLVRWL